MGICLYNPLESLLLLSATLWIQFYFCLPNDLKFGLHSSWPSNNDENSIYLPGRFILRFMKCFSKNQKRLSLLFCFKNEEIYRGLKNIKRKKIIMSRFGREEKASKEDYRKWDCPMGLRDDTMIKNTDCSFRESGFNLSIHMVLTTIFNSNFCRPDTLCWLLHEPGTHAVHIYRVGQNTPPYYLN